MGEIEDLRSFRRLIAALQPWIGQVVVVGGWAHHLYRFHPSAKTLDYPALSTLDTDIALPKGLLVGQQNIRERLKTYGFNEELFGEDNPPATHYRLGGDTTGFYAEFLTSLEGSELDRRHKRKATLQIAGVVSQQLRYIDILLLAPWSVQFNSDDMESAIQIANPVGFIAQKILIQRLRDSVDRAKDILYIHDTLEVFGARLPELKACWRETVAPQLTDPRKKAVLAARTTLFGDLTDDIRRASEISAPRALSAESLIELCRYGLDQVFM